MPGWDEILDEVQKTKSECDYVRHKYLSQLSQFTGRNTITYYSSWLTKNSVEGLDINDMDINGFMNTVKGLNCSKGLDLILHTPGGSPTAAETIINYLRKKFNSDIRVIVPQLAMSAGTMIACAAKEIVMGNQSSLGPIDPQFKGIPAYNIVSEFEEAKQDLASNPQNANYWAIKLRQYPAAFLKTANDAIELSGKLVEEWLGTCMYDASKLEDKKIIDNIVIKLNDHDNSKNHGRHLSADFCIKAGLKIQKLEEVPDLQNAVLSVHHAYMITLINTEIGKLIENQDNKCFAGMCNVR